MCKNIFIKRVTKQLLVIEMSGVSSDIVTYRYKRSQTQKISFRNINNPISFDPFSLHFDMFALVSHKKASYRMYLIT